MVPKQRSDVLPLYELGYQADVLYADRFSAAYHRNTLTISFFLEKIIGIQKSLLEGFQKII